MNRNLITLNSAYLEQKCAKSVKKTRPKVTEVSQHPYFRGVYGTTKKQVTVKLGKIVRLLK